MSSREKKKLLALIHTSFQRHLDKETANGQYHTSEHLQSVLTSPLLSPKRTDSLKVLSNSRLQRGKSLNEAQERDRRPLTVFKEHVSKGTASLGRARLCLSTLLQQCTQDYAASTVTAMASAGVSPCFRSWLWSSGMAETGTFLQDVSFVKLLTSFLVAEQQYEVVMQWLFRLRSPRSTYTLQPEEKERTQAVLLLQLVKAESEYGAGIGGAMTHFVQNLKCNEASIYKQPAEIFRPAGYYISDMLSDPQRMQNVSAEIADAFISCTKSWSHRDSLVYAWQHAYHPTQPSPDLGVKYLEQVTKEKALRLTAHKKSLVLRMSLRIAELFMKRDELARASAILHFLRVHFANDIGAERERVTPDDVSDARPAPNQKENLRLLEVLAVS